LPPERAVDYRPKDVALHEETAELETPRRINLLPFVAVLGIAALAGLIWWAVTQFSDEIGDSITAAQTQIALWQQPAATPAVAMREESAALPENLVAPPVTAADTTPVTANVEATPLVADSAPAASVPAEVAAPTPVVEPTPPPEAQPEAPAVSLAALLPTPTPQPAEVAPPAEAVQPATVITAANLRQSPSTEAPIVGAATEGETLAIVGRTADGAWFQLESGAWIFAQLVNNPPADLPVVEAPPVATTP
jgi:cytoskeletal protein RodZ